MNTEKIISMGCDHGAYLLKNAVRDHLTQMGYKIIDHGTDGPESVHYPIYADAACKDLQNGKADFGILICSTGIGMSMAANKHRHIRAALCGDTYSARYTRLHNNANVLCMGANVIGTGLALDIVDTFLSNDFEGGRHAIRIGMVDSLEDTEWKENK